LQINYFDSVDAGWQHATMNLHVFQVGHVCKQFRRKHRSNPIGA